MMQPIPISLMVKYLTFLTRWQNDINNIRDDIGTLAESNSNIQEGIQNVKDITDESYMLAITAIGVDANWNTYSNAAAGWNSLIFCQH